MLAVTIFSKVLPILLLLAVGVLLRKLRFLSEQTMMELKKLVVNVSLPALLFIAFLDTDFEAKYLWIIAVVFAANLVMLAVGKALNVIMGKGNPYFPFMFTGFEMGMMGFSLFGTAFGLQSLSAFGIVDLGQEVYVWLVLVPLLVGMKGGDGSPGKILLSFAASPVLIGIFLGLLFNITGLGRWMTNTALPAAVLSTISMISQLTIPLILIVIGYQLNLKISKLRRPLLTIALRTVILVALAAAIDHFVLKGILHLPVIFSAALFTMFILPPPFIIPLFMDSRHSDQQDYISNTLTLGTLMTIAAFIVVVVVFK